MLLIQQVNYIHSHLILHRLSKLKKHLTRELSLHKDYLSFLRNNSPLRSILKLLFK